MVYDTLNKKWKEACKVVFGQEIGELKDYEEWLSEYKNGGFLAKSSFSGKEVLLTQNDYEVDSAFISFDEIDRQEKFEPISINDMKDIESLCEAISDRILYTGNIILGNSNKVERSSNVQDSYFVLDSTVVSDSKYVAFCQYVSHADAVFGLLGSDRSAYTIKCMGSDLNRCFECHMVNYLSDCYYCAKTQNCHDCMFCFGLENAKYAIGNTQIPVSKYRQIKKKLLDEIVESLKKNRSVYSLFHIIERCSSYGPDSRLKWKKEQEMAFNIAPIEIAFENTSKLLFGRKIGSITKFEKYLQRHVPKNRVIFSPLSGSKTVAAGYRVHLLEKFGISSRIVTDQEIRNVGKMTNLVDIDSLSFDLNTLCSRFHTIAYINLDKVVGKCNNYKNNNILFRLF